MNRSKLLILLVIFLAALASIGAKGCELQPGPVNLPTPSPGSPVLDPSPGCAATGTARECYDRRPGEPWAWICADGLTRVTGPAECPSGPPATACAVPHGEWTKQPPSLPTLHERVNATMARLTGCGVRSDCAVADGSDRIGRVAGAKNYEAFGRRVTAGLIEDGICAGFHADPNPPDEIAVRNAAGQYEGYKVATDGGKIKVAWAGMPSRPCFGEECRSIGGGSYRGNWLPGGRPAPTPAPGPTPATGPDLTCRAPEKVEIARHGTAPGGELVFDLTFKAPDRARCLSLGKSQDRCGLGPDCTAPGEGTTPEAKVLEDPRCLGWRAAKEACEDQMIGVPVWSGTAPQIKPQGRGFIAKIRGPGTLRGCSAFGLCSAEVTVP